MEPFGEPSNPFAPHREIFDFDEREFRRSGRVITALYEHAVTVVDPFSGATTIRKRKLAQGDCNHRVPLDDLNECEVCSLTEIRIVCFRDVGICGYCGRVACRNCLVCKVLDRKMSALLDVSTDVRRDETNHGELVEKSCCVECYDSVVLPRWRRTLKRAWNALRGR